MNIKHISLAAFLVFSIFLNPHLSAKNQTLSDTAITTEVKAKIADDPTMSVFDIHVSTENGVVRLSGSLNTETEASSLIEITESVDGVKDIDTSALHVKESKRPLTDTYITAKVKGLLVREKLLSHKDVAPIAIHVETKNGVVYLSGTVDNQQQLNNAISLAKSVSGVKKVESRVEVLK